MEEACLRSNVRGGIKGRTFVLDDTGKVPSSAMAASAALIDNGTDVKFFLAHWFTFFLPVMLLLAL